MEKHWAVIRGGYVIQVVLWDDQANPDWSYQEPHDTIVHDPEARAGIGDWYEATEGIFYRPLSAPPDLPLELQ